MRPSRRMTKNVWKTWLYCSFKYSSRLSDDSRARAAPTSDATRTASRRGERAGMEPAIRSVIQRKSAPSAASINARNANRPRATRQYRLRCQRLGIGSLISRAPHGENDFRLAGIRFHFFAQSLHQRVDAAHSHVCLILPDAVQQRFATEDNAGAREQHREQLEFVRREIDVAGADAHAPAR